MLSASVEMTVTTAPNPTPDPQLAMPSREAMVDEAIARLDTLGLRSQIVDLDTSTLRGLCLRLTDRKVTVAAAHQWLNRELGADIDHGEQVVDDNAVYRFASHFRRVYGQVRSEHAARLARLTVAHATDGNIRSMTRVAQARLVELMAARLVEADNLEDLGPGELKAVMLAVRFAQQAQQDADQLELARRQAEDRAAKLQADIDRIRADQRRQDARLHDRVKSLQQTIDDLSKRVERGQAIDPSLFASIRRELIDLAPPATGGDT